MNEINIYCDESSHLSYDNKDYMILGAVYCKKEVRERVCNDIKRIKQKYNIRIKQRTPPIKSDVLVSPSTHGR